MKKFISLIVIGFSLLMIETGIALATPSTEYWTPDVMDVQPYGVLHLGVDNYFTVLRNANNSKPGDFSAQPGAFGTDVGLTIGVLPYEKIQLEVGVDLIEPSPFGVINDNSSTVEYGKDVPLSFNFKFGTPEDSLFKGSPGIAVGMFNIGTAHDSTTCGLGCATNYNIADLIVGKTLGPIGRVHIGGYYGNENLLIDNNGAKNNKGMMFAWDRYIVKDKVQLAADWATGQNAFGGGGVGVYYYFAPNASILVGPVWYNQPAFNGPMKWTTQLDVNF
ncbi:MAG TPA: hypothetical protein VMN77_09435 [Nitrospiria bacterium]|jgi:hypothetical protein|nr:hypothetical protein [Nitrospiria bacterium]